MRIIRAKTTSPAFQETAYTIPEVMVAVLVVAIMMICLYGGFSSSFTMTKIARENLRATQILMQRMETIRLYTWTQLLNTNYVQPKFSEVYDPLSVPNASGVKYVGTMAVAVPTTLPTGYTANVRQVTVTVFWTNSFSRSNTIVHSRQMQTYCAQNGMQNYILGK